MSPGYSLNRFLECGFNIEPDISRFVVSLIWYWLLLTCPPPRSRCEFSPTNRRDITHFSWNELEMWPLIFRTEHACPWRSNGAYGCEVFYFIHPGRNVFFTAAAVAWKMYLLPESVLASTVESALNSMNGTKDEGDIILLPIPSWWAGPSSPIVQNSNLSEKS
jgi:hypothetical protein